MPRRVEPHRYADTPIFRAMLYERDGRYPGTPEGEEDLPKVVLTQEVPEDAIGPQTPAQGLLSRMVPVSAMAVTPVMPVLADPERDGERTQAMPVPLFVEPDDEGA